jgi:hypothetical protein
LTAVAPYDAIVAVRGRGDRRQQTTPLSAQQSTPGDEVEVSARWRDSDSAGSRAVRRHASRFRCPYGNLACTIAGTAHALTTQLKTPASARLQTRPLIRAIPFRRSNDTPPSSARSKREPRTRLFSPHRRGGRRFARRRWRRAAPGRWTSSPDRLPLAGGPHALPGDPDGFSSDHAAGLLVWEHINPYGRYDLGVESRLAI